jgi:drug/metabolite transporter (DMT)-like permease
MILVAGTFWVLMAGLLVWALFGHPRRVPADGRPTLRWFLAGALLMETAALLGMIGEQYNWARVHRVVGAAGLLLCLAALACLATAFITRRRLRRPLAPRR